MKDKVKHARDYVLTQEEIKRILNTISKSNKAGQYDKFIFTVLVHTGMRANEFAHMKKSWVHINDKTAIDFGRSLDKSDPVNHILIPKREMTPCYCVDCQLQAFFEEEREKESKNSTDWDWYQEKRKEFYLLKKCNKLEKKEYFWSPKSDAGHRRIPIVFTELENELTTFFSTNEFIPLTRLGIWYRIKRISKYTNRKELYPHVLRATCATLFAWKGFDAMYLKNFMGWSNTAIADIYVRVDERKMFIAAEKLVKERW